MFINIDQVGFPHIIFYFLFGVDTGIWTNVTNTINGPSARFSMAGDCLDPFKGGVLVFIGGCNKSLEALDDMYYLHTGSTKCLIFYRIKFSKAMVLLWYYYFSVALYNRL